MSGHSPLNELSIHRLLQPYYKTVHSYTLEPESCASLPQFTRAISWLCQRLYPLRVYNGVPPGNRASPQIQLNTMQRIEIKNPSCAGKVSSWLQSLSCLVDMVRYTQMELLITYSHSQEVDFAIQTLLILWSSNLATHYNHLGDVWVPSMEILIELAGHGMLAWEFLTCQPKHVSRVENYCRNRRPEKERVFVDRRD